MEVGKQDDTVHYIVEPEVLNPSLEDTACNSDSKK